MIVVRVQASLLLIIQFPCMSVLLPAQPCQWSYQAEWDDSGMPCWSNPPAIHLSCDGRGKAQCLRGSPLHLCEGDCTSQADGYKRSQLRLHKTIKYSQITSCVNVTDKGTLAFTAQWPWAQYVMSVSLFPSLENGKCSLFKIVLEDQ